MNKETTIEFSLREGLSQLPEPFRTKQLTKKVWSVSGEYTSFGLVLTCKWVSDPSKGMGIDDKIKVKLFADEEDESVFVIQKFSDHEVAFMLGMIPKGPQSIAEESVASVAPAEEVESQNPEQLMTSENTLADVNDVSEVTSPEVVKNEPELVRRKKKKAN